MKIIHIITDFSNVYGAQKHTIECIKDHLINGYDCKVYTGKKGEASHQIEKLGVEVVEFAELERNYNLWNDVKLIKKIATQLKTDNPTIVISHSSKAGVISRVACYITKVPNIFTVHGWSFEKGTPFIQKKVGWILEYLVKYAADKYICVSNYTANFGIKSLHLKKQNVFVCAPMHNKLNTAIEQPTTNTFTILMVAGFRYQKDHKTALIALKKVIATCPNVKLILVGDGIEKENIVALAKTLQIDNYIDFVGEINNVANYYNSSQLVILPTFYEGLPITLLEAAQCSKPMIATNVGGISEIIIDNKNGFLIKVKDTNALATHIKSLIDNKTLLLQMGNFSQQHYANHFSNTKNLAMLNSIISQCISSSKFNKG